MEIKQQKSLSEFYQGKRILITGASGYIAWKLIKQLVKFDCTLICFSRDAKKVEQQKGNASFHFIEGSYQDEVAFEKAVKNIDIIYHLASQTSIYEAEKNPTADYGANVKPIQLLLEVCRKEKTCPIIVFSGTSTQCGMPKKLPVDENVVDDPITTYDFHKLQAERWLKFYTRKGWVRGLSLRLTNVYGPGPKSSNADRGILNMMIRKALQGEDLTLYGKGRNLRDYIYMKDVVGAFLAAGKNISDLNGRHFVIGSGESHTLKEAFSLVAECVKRKTGINVKIVHVDPLNSRSPIDDRNFVSDSSRFRMATGWLPSIQLEEGIDRTINWFLNDVSDKLI
jgi:nucleoside-diphosphate-sugar epimerase